MICTGHTYVSKSDRRTEIADNRHNSQRTGTTCLNNDRITGITNGQQKEVQLT